MLCFSEKQCYSQLFCFEMCVPCRNVCFCFGVTPATGNSNSTPGVAISNWPKKPQHPSKKICDQRHIKTRINQLINLQWKARRLSLLIVLVPVVCPQSGNLHECWVWGVGSERNYSLRYFEFGLQYPFQPLTVNITYCTFLHFELHF